VRKLFSLEGAGLNASNVEFLDPPAFAKTFPTGEIVEDLLHFSSTRVMIETVSPGRF